MHNCGVTHIFRNELHNKVIQQVVPLRKLINQFLFFASLPLSLSLSVFKNFALHDLRTFSITDSACTSASELARENLCSKMEKRWRMRKFSGPYDSRLQGLGAYKDLSIAASGKSERDKRVLVVYGCMCVFVCACVVGRESKVTGSPAPVT